ncbi:hypothetical protein [Burkholderia alba]|nr:hypothetical protein [Burkholderia alba]
MSFDQVTTFFFGFAVGIFAAALAIFVGVALGKYVVRYEEE